MLALSLWVAPQPVHANERIHFQRVQPTNNQGVWSPIQGPARFIGARPVKKAPVKNNQLPKAKVLNKNSSTTRGPETEKASGRNYSKEEVKALIIKYSELYGIPSNVPLCIAYHESGYNQYSKNKNSSASGVFQYLTGTWRGTDEGKSGLSVFDADANVKAAIKYMASRKSTQPWEVRNKCPKLTK